jgi:hypothetical protein
MSQTKVVRRSVAIALGTACIVTISILATLAMVIIQENDTIQSYKNQIDSLNSQLSNQTIIENLMFSEVVFNQSVSLNAGQHLDVYNLTAANYSGFVDVSFEGSSSSLSSTWIKVEWGVNYNVLMMHYNETRSFDEMDTFVWYSTYGDYMSKAVFPTIDYGYDNVTVGNNGNKTIGELVTITYYY